ncbi:MAG: hypothetical protein PHN98_04415 [Smithellaceae bacterium]|nr:hypothetical protein [Smithellaceae bacterium]
MLSQYRDLSKVPAVAVILLMVLSLSGCAANSQVGKKVSKGSVVAVVGAAAAGAVSGLVTGGPIGAIQGGITGATSSAISSATGVVAGVIEETETKEVQKSQIKDLSTRQKELAELEARIGKKNYGATLLLADCHHRRAIEMANEAFGESKDSTQRTYALLLQAIAAEEMGDKALAASFYPKIIQESPQCRNLDKARADALEGVLKIQQLRRDHGLPPLCSP